MSLLLRKRIFVKIFSFFLLFLHKILTKKRQKNKNSSGEGGKGGFLFDADEDDDDD
tara:strand:- start:3237 stop:3404 length:168 start_codon:yes stop_codon:yes gene_type:complete